MWYQHENDTQGFWYRATFGPQMPDWNLTCRHVCQHHLRVAYFWLVEIGVDGFRLDAVKAITLSSSRRGSWHWLRNFVALCHQFKPSGRILGELTMSSTVIATAQVLGAMDLGFEFALTEAIYESVLSKKVAPLTQILALMVHLYSAHGGSYVTFLSNHDQDRAASRVDRSKLAFVTVVWLLLPGTPCVYYGDEVGMQGCRTDTDRRRPIWKMERRAFNMSLYHLYKVMLKWRRGVSWETFAWTPQTSSQVRLSWSGGVSVLIDMEERTFHTTKGLRGPLDVYTACVAHTATHTHAPLHKLT
jgi:glycosidase